jgi:hypothetical protein
MQIKKLANKNARRNFANNIQNQPIRMCGNLALIKLSLRL